MAKRYAFDGESSDIAIKLVTDAKNLRLKPEQTAIVIDYYGSVDESYRLNNNPYIQGATAVVFNRRLLEETFSYPLEVSGDETRLSIFTNITVELDEAKLDEFMQHVVRNGDVTYDQLRSRTIDAGGVEELLDAQIKRASYDQLTRSSKSKVERKAEAVISMKSKDYGLRVWSAVTIRNLDEEDSAEYLNAAAKTQQKVKLSKLEARVVEAQRLLLQANMEEARTLADLIHAQTQKEIAEKQSSDMLEDYKARRKREYQAHQEATQDWQSKKEDSNTRLVEHEEKLAKKEAEFKHKQSLKTIKSQQGVERLAHMLDGLGIDPSEQEGKKVFVGGDLTINQGSSEEE